MRPVSLHIEGFGVFRDPVDLSFDSVDYFALVGPTGSGKSTVIDAICFALYGSVSRYLDARLVGRAVSVGKQEAKVSLTFTVGERRYCATRVVRVRDGKATTPEAVLEELADGDGPTHLLASKAREMRGAVERLLGLPFDHFTRCVVLPQGEFARFLHDDPADRQKLLARLLGLEVYKEIGQRARERGAAARAAIEGHERQLAGLASATDDARRTAERRRDDLRDLLDAIDGARREEERLRGLVVQEATEAARAIELVAVLEAVEIPDDVATLSAAIDAARHARARTTEAVDVAERALAAADQAVEAAPAREPLLRARDAHVAIDELRHAGEALLVEAKAARDASADARRAEQEAVQAAADAQHALDAARDTHIAHALADSLIAGEPCPVCGHHVERPPKRARPAALSGAERALAAAGRRAEAARAAAAAAAVAQVAIETRAAQTAERLDGLAVAIADHPDHQELEHTLAALDATLAAQTEARRGQQEARRRDARAIAEEDAAAERAGGAAQALQSRRDECLRAGLDPPDLGDDLGGAWECLANWARAAAEVQQGLAGRARVRADAAAAELQALLADLRRRAGVVAVSWSDATDLTNLRDEVVEQVTRTANVLARLEEQMETAGKLREQLEAARTEQQVADLLALHMRADRFERWLLSEALALLVAGASDTLYGLSGGAYSLRYSDDEEFLVVDHRNADATRSVRTLSGGETFQASLALALSLSAQLAALSAADGVTLDAIFLDEGFGTLDADSLETVANTIEALGSSGRMVGLVTHVPALAERVPVRYRVNRLDRSATVTREEL